MLDALPHLNFTEGSVPMWGTFSIVLGLALRHLFANRKLSIDSDGKLRDHYATEVSSLRTQLLEVQRISDARAANAEKRYTEAIEAADRRHEHCEKVCDKLREKVVGLERQIMQLQQSSLKLFEPKSTLPEATRTEMMKMEQSPLDKPVPRRGRS